MARDPLLWKRNAFVIPGGLLAAYSILGIAYGLWLRVPRAGCAQGEVLLGGCQNIAIVLLPTLVLGLALVAFGLLRYRSDPADLEGHLHHGTGAHFTLVFLGSLVVVSMAGWIWATMRQASLDPGQFLVVEAAGVQYEFSFVMRLLMVGSMLALAAAGGMYLTQDRLRTSFLAAAQAPEPMDEAYMEPAAEPTLAAYGADPVAESRWEPEPADEPVAQQGWQPEPADEPMLPTDAEE